MNHLKTYESFVLDKSGHVNAVNSLKNVKITPLQDAQPLGDIYRHIFVKLVDEFEYIPYEDKMYRRKVKCITLGRYHTSTESFGSINYYESLDEAATDIPLRDHVTTERWITSWDNLVELLNSNQNPFSGKFVDILDYNPINFQEIENILDDLGYQLDIENMWAILN